MRPGDCVAALDISIENLVPLKSIYSEGLLILNCDVADQSQVKDSVSLIGEKWGQVDVLVNNAYLAVFKPFE